MDWRERIESDPKAHGKPRVRGTGVPVSEVLGKFAARLDFRDVLKSHPALSEDDVRACLAWAAHASELGEDSDVEPQHPERPAKHIAPTGTVKGFKEFLRSVPNDGDDADFERPTDYGRPEIEWDT